ncbi:fungal-specific transcription factor domain-containing protein [Penicillium robsamsonii]|uniref:fungal-specific transcription factor domain-containing protein n=1 Tax=Penicillium robsamsonii TaxID=1792511 RepID=UPI00254658AD|nr:fungal-specific transcription factor domain-containing protein [Penicillium robsamsonii]KAJ5817409.1 fungal-specific transcription factor domain-containing protein [Penicillium robsamsonii]
MKFESLRLRPANLATNAEAGKSAAPKRNETCHFTQTKRKRRTSPSVSESSQMLEPSSEKIRIRPIVSPVFLDQMLENHGSSGILRDSFALLRHTIPNRSSLQVTSSSLAFFSERRIHSLSQRLGNDRLNELVETIESVIRSRLLAQGPSSISLITFRKPSDIEQVPLDEVRLYIDSYFNQLHPMYPFLDRKEFEDKVFGPHRSEILSSSCAFSALYHTVLALGCRYHEGGTFDPGNGRAWKLFQVSLGLVSDILIPREALMSLQALVAMSDVKGVAKPLSRAVQSIFAMTISCLQIDEVLLTEAARMAQGLGYHRALGNGDQRHKSACHRTFWVIYYMEKHLCFQNQNGSIIPDYDIGCPIPDAPESVFGEYNWFLSAIGFGRILSQAYTALFSVSAAIQTTEAYHIAVEEIETRLERWRTAVPVKIRPGMLFREPNMSTPSFSSSFPEPSFKMIVLQTNFSYYALVIALARLKMYIGRQDEPRKQEESKRLLMDTARAIVEGSKNVDMAAHTPNFILTLLPLAALFILFDFVVHNPTHPETRNNLSLLDVAAGHFSLLDYKSGGFLPASLLTEFAHIARQYVKDSGREQQKQPGELGPSITTSILADTEFSSGLSQTNNDDNVELPYNTIGPWEERDYLYYPVTPETTVHGLVENPMTASFNFQSLFGFVVPEFGQDR